MNNTMSNPQARSILGPMLLIAAGALWLLSAQGLVSTSSVWGVLRYWPLLLIALGVDALLRWRWPILANLADVIFVGLAVAAIVFAPQLGLSAGGGWMGWMPFTIGATPGSGHVITETRDVSNFDSVTFTSFGDLTIQPGEREGLTIEAEDNLLREIRTEVRGGRLYIGLANGGDWARFRPTRPIRFTLTVVQLEALDLSGAGNVKLQGLQTDRLQATLSGAGNIALVDLTADDLACDLTGAGNMDASGTVGHLEVVVSGVGGFKGADLQSGTARVMLSGLGGATVWAVDRLEATVSGLGSVDYYGQPQVSQNVSGLGSVRHSGDK